MDFVDDVYEMYGFKNEDVTNFLEENKETVFKKLYYSNSGLGFRRDAFICFVAGQVSWNEKQDSKLTCGELLKRISKSG